MWFFKEQTFAVDEAVFGFIVFLVCTEHRVIVHPVSNGEISYISRPLSLSTIFFFLPASVFMTVVNSV
jgi:hypothetical protein